MHEKKFSIDHSVREPVAPKAPEPSFQIVPVVIKITTTARTTYGDPHRGLKVLFIFRIGSDMRKSFSDTQLRHDRHIF